MNKRIEIQELSVEGFKEFGQIISTDGRTKDGGDENHGWYEKIGSFKNIDEVSVNILECKARALTIDRLEVHKQTAEAIIPLGGEEVIVVLAPAGEMNESRINAFRIPGDKGIMLDIGVRHFIPYPTGSRSVNCIIIFKHATGANDLVFDMLSETYNIG